MQWIKYQIIQSIIDEQPILIDKKVGYSESNLAIAQSEAYMGIYEITEDSEEYEKEPLPIELGGTGAKTAEEARKNLGIGENKDQEEIDTLLTAYFGSSEIGTIAYKKSGRAICLSAYLLNLKNIGTEDFYDGVLQIEISLIDSTGTFQWPNNKGNFGNFSCIINSDSKDFVIGQIRPGRVKDNEFFLDIFVNVPSSTKTIDVDFNIMFLI